MQYSRFAFIEDCEGRMLEEISVKQQRVLEFLDRRGIHGILLRRRENVSWITAGCSDRTVLIPSSEAIASILLLRDGRKYYLAANNESERLADEDFNGLGFEPILYNWHEQSACASLPSELKDGLLASDSPCGSLQQVDIAPLRWQLLPQEMARYRELGRVTAEAGEQVLLGLEPGISEREMAARVAHHLLSAGVEPSVLLMAVDDRIRKYKHALPQDARLQKFGMLNLCARRWGLSVSVTRYVHYGAMPAELSRCFQTSARVYAALLNATQQGLNAAQCFSVAGDVYASCGYPGEEFRHHQGGAAGYLEREWLARPGGSEAPTAPQAFAWNPSISGAKTEETVLLHTDRIEPITLGKTLPLIESPAADEIYKSTGVLVR
jgi:antitoxin VapB